MCGLIGHEDRACNIIFKTGEKAQFRPWLRAFMDRKRNSGDDRGRWAGGRASSNGPRGSTWHSTLLSVRCVCASTRSATACWRHYDSSEVVRSVSRKKKAETLCFFSGWALGLYLLAVYRVSRGSPVGSAQKYCPKKALKTL